MCFIEITDLCICFRANSDIRLVTAGFTRSARLKFKDVDRIQGGIRSDNFPKKRMSESLIAAATLVLGILGGNK